MVQDFVRSPQVIVAHWRKTVIQKDTCSFSSGCLFFFSRKKSFLFPSFRAIIQSQRKTGGAGHEKG